jgi:hypothetical protein
MTRASIAVAFYLLASTAAPSMAQQVAAHGGGGAGGIHHLAWLAGCWEEVRGDRIIEEQWMAPRGGLMLGQNRTVEKGKAAFELMRIFERGDSLIFAATIVGQPTVEFTSARPTGKSITFSNPAHDFPQRVMYSAKGDSIAARIEGTINGKVRGVDFKFARAACVKP